MGVALPLIPAICRGRGRRPPDRKIGPVRAGPIDLHHLGNDRSVGVYLVDTADGPALFDCGPASTLPALKQGLAQAGLALTDVRHLLLSHIHLDHAGAAGAPAPEHPGPQGHAPAIAAPPPPAPTRPRPAPGRPP